MSEKVKKEGIDRTAIILIGKAINPRTMTKYSKLYSKDFKHTFRDKKKVRLVESKLDYAIFTLTKNGIAVGKRLIERIDGSILFFASEI